MVRNAGAGDERPSFYSHCGKDWIRQESLMDTNSRGNFIINSIFACLCTKCLLVAKGEKEHYYTVEKSGDAWLSDQNEHDQWGTGEHRVPPDVTPWGHSITCAAFQSRRHNLNLVIIKGNTRQTQCEGRRGKDCIYQCHQRQRKLWKCFRLKETSKETWPLNETSHSRLDPLLEGKIAIKGIIRSTDKT